MTSEREVLRERIAKALDDPDGRNLYTIDAVLDALGLEQVEQPVGGFGCHRRMVGPPPGHDMTGDIRPVEAQVEYVGDTFVFRTRWLPTEREIERLKNGEPLWVSQWTSHMVPFDVAMTEEVEDGK